MNFCYCRQGHSYEIDYYCLGALLYELVTGLPPFYSRDHNQLFENILTSSLTFPSHLSNELKDFLTNMLQKDINLRFKTINQIYEHPWVSSKHSKSDVLNLNLIPPYPTNMFLYNFDDSEFGDHETMFLKMIERETSIETY